jgi:hypothetical protein
MAATPAESSTGTVEALFRRSTRYRDSRRNRRGRGRLPGDYKEVELLPGLTVENVLATCTTWDDYRRFLRSKVVWMTTHVYVCSQDMTGTDDPYVLMLGGDDGTKRLRVHVVQGTPPAVAAAAATATCDFLLRLLATCDKRDLSLQGRDDTAPTPISGAALSLFFQESREDLRKVSLNEMTLNEEQIRALTATTESRPALEVNLSYCSLSDGIDCQNAFVECLQNDRGPTELIMCRIDIQILASALTGNSRVTKLRLDIYRTVTNAAGKGAIFSALANNKGLVDLDLRNCPIDDDNWTVLCESLKTHPSLISLDLRDTRPTNVLGVAIMLTAEQKTQRTRALAEMMKMNTVLCIMELSESHYDQQIYTEEVRPLLETHLYRTRVLAISKADISLRRPLLGLALQNVSVRNESNLLWMFLSGNADVI